MTVFKSTDYHSSSAVHACPRVKSPGHRLGRCASPFSWTQVNLTFLCGVSVQLVKRWKLYALVLYDILHKSSDVLRYITTRLSQANTVGKNACRRVKETHIAESHVAVCRCNIPVSSIHRPPPFWLWIVHQESLLKILCTIRCQLSRLGSPFTIDESGCAEVGRSWPKAHAENLAGLQ